MKEIIQVCEVPDCDHKPLEVRVGKQLHIFCCKKGFEKSLQEFKKHLK